ncbi:MAG: phage tail protein [Rubrivivax sp.]|jgi:hypothetical protein|nr:phage tail protein [Rubrivivax sp.]
MQLSIKTNFPDVQRQLEGLRKDVATKATGRSLNRTMEQARTQMVRRITAEYDIKAGKVREKLRINRARLTGGLLELEASLESQTKGGRRSVNVINFSPRKVAGGVTIKVRRNGQRRLIRGAFIANKGRTVFARQEGTRMRSRRWGGQHGEQIEPVQTIDVPQMFNARKIREAVLAAIRARFPVIFQREVAFELSRWGAR